MLMNTGKFIVLEGIDGCGTSTQAAILGKFLSHYSPTIVEREPWPEGMERVIRDHIERGTGPDEMAVLFTADRIRHMVEKILPALRQGVHVICDRYRMSTLVYQTHGRPNSEQRLVRKLTRLPDLINPDMTIVIDLSAEEAAQRLPEKRDRYERDTAFQEAIRQAYIAEGPGEGAVLVDGSRPVQDVAKVIRGLMWKLNLPTE